MLFDYYQTDRMLICIDRGGFDLINDFYRNGTRGVVDCANNIMETTRAVIAQGDRYGCRFSTIVLQVWSAKYVADCYRARLYRHVGQCERDHAGVLGLLRRRLKLMDVCWNMIMNRLIGGQV